MRQVLTAITAAFFLAACGTLAQPEAQQTEGITIDMAEPTAECHVEAEAVDDLVHFTASAECVENMIIPLTVRTADLDASSTVTVGGSTVFVGGVYAWNTSTWWPPSGEFQVHSDGDLLGSITVP